MAKITIGIAGGMGAGKSELCRRLSERFGAEWISVDEERRKIAGSSPCGFAALWEASREQVKQIVRERIQVAQGVVMIEWARLVEDGFLEMADTVVALECPKQIRVARLSGGDLSIDQIQARMDAQMSDEELSCSLAKSGVEHRMLDSSKPISEGILSEIHDEWSRAEFSSSAGFCLFRIPRKGGRVIWEVTNSCNYGCRYCIFSSTPRRPEGELGTAKMLHTIDELASLGYTHIKFTGGEPLMRPDLMAILRHAKARGFKCDLSTNAAFIDDAAALELASMGLEMVHVSLDGADKRIQESARGARTYEPTMAGLQALCAKGVHVRVGTVVFKGNQGSLGDIASLCHGLGVGELIYSLMEPAGRMRGKTSALCTLAVHELESIVEGIALQFKGRMKISGNFAQIVASGCGSCPGGERFLFIDHRGAVSPCTWVSERAPEFKAGQTLHESSLEQILNGPQIVKFKSVAKSLARSGLDRCPMQIAPKFAGAAKAMDLFQGDLGANLARGGRFSEASPLYPFCNENIGAWMGELDVAGRDVLLVGSSGDPMICAYAAGAKSVECFDLNALAKHFGELKWTMLSKLSRLSFIEFFQGLEHSVYEAFKHRLSLEARNFFDQAYGCHGLCGEDLATSALFRKVQPIELLMRNMPYLASDQAYQHARASCEGKDFAWRAIGAIQEAALPQSFDAIGLSNLADYAGEMFGAGALEKFAAHLAVPMLGKLRPGGRMMIGYAYGADPSQPGARSPVDDPACRRGAFASRPAAAYREAALARAWGAAGQDLALIWEAPWEA